MFGAFSPINGSHFLLELPHCNTANFQLFLNEMAQEKPDEFMILVLDNGAFHKAKALMIPENMALLFLPPYSPKLNPVEKMWTQFKRKFTNLFCKTLDDLSDFIQCVVQNLRQQNVKNTCAFDYIFLNLNIGLFNNHIWHKLGYIVITIFLKAPLK